MPNEPVPEATRCRYGLWRPVELPAHGAQLDEHGVVYGPINSIADIANDPHILARDMIVRVEDERFGDIAVPGMV